MSRSARRVALGTGILAAVLSGCIAPDVEVSGALGVTVDEEARPVLVVEACDGGATVVSLSFDREGLTDDEVNEDIGQWTAAEPVPGASELALHAPAAPWQGEAVELPVDRGYIAGGQGAAEGEVLTQVSFRGPDLAGLDPALVYRNDPDSLTNLDADPGDSALVASTPEEFSAQVCSRG
ncbi:hypothetical protein [Ornithinimicrobium cryptoxanthini]|uniref:Secreted protein n=1 Tax=Ornithinimicrobium cryptoxanthini TaxID=2934161 RepID=A0ABY4YLJ9_9MICO|nr:hypothetical protein [Ornithinimicrobium cryptoxanthini]USQ77223.1 hypothetical protein NF557_04730 [Ornithinimicrobium cryptoxanthini]